MSAKSGRADSTTHDLARRHNLPSAALGLAILTLLWVCFLRFPHALVLGLATLGLLAVGLVAAMRVWAAKSGSEEPAPGEDETGETVEEILEQLGDAPLILGDVVCQFGQIDHVVLSRNHGVFLLEIKADSGRVAVVDSKIRVNGQLPETDLIGQTLQNTYWLIEELEAIAGVRPVVTSLIVFTKAFVAPSRPVKGITITDKKFLLEKMRELGQPLPAQIWEAREKIAGLFAAAGKMSS